MLIIKIVCVKGGVDVQINQTRRSEILPANAIGLRRFASKISQGPRVESHQADAAVEIAKQQVNYNSTSKNSQVFLLLCLARGAAENAVVIHDFLRKMSMSTQ